MEICRPAWADPAYMLLTNDIKWTEIEVTTVEPVIILRNSPLRWGFLILSNYYDAFDIAISPFNDPAQFGMMASYNAFTKPFTMHEYGPLVQQEWYASTRVGKTIRVIEFLIKG